MNSKDLTRRAIPLGESPGLATDCISKFILAGHDEGRLEEEVKVPIATAREGRLC